MTSSLTSSSSPSSPSFSSTSTSPSAGSSHGSSSPSTGAIAGGVVGGVAAVVTALLISIYYFRKKNSKPQSAELDNRKNIRKLHEIGATGRAPDAHEADSVPRYELLDRKGPSSAVELQEAPH